MKRSTLAFAAVAILVAAAPRARAQEQERAHLGVDRLGSFLSWAWTDHGTHGHEIGADLDIGSIFSPRLRLAVGLNYFHANIDRLNHLETIAAIQEGIASAERGELKPAEQVLAEMLVKKYALQS